jgi:ABC-type bacteriocin/lantibiotic exporter with double-glycine peptidase domain
MLVLRLLSADRWRAFLCAAIIAAVSVSGVFPALTYRALVERIVPASNLPVFLIACGALFVFLVGRSLLVLLQDYEVLLQRQRIERAAVVAGMHRAAVGLDIDRTISGVKTFLSQFQHFWGQVVYFVVYSLLMSTLTLVIFVLLQPVYALLGLVFLILHGVNIRFSRRATTRVAKSFFAAKSALLEEIAVHDRAMMQVRSLDGVAFATRRFDERVAAFAREHALRDRVNYRFRTRQNALNALFYLAFFATSLAIAGSDGASFGATVLCLFISGYLFDPLFRVAPLFRQYHDAAEYCAWLPDGLARDEASARRAVVAPGGTCAVAITLSRGAEDGDTHAYDLVPGDIHFIKGRSGIGKTTLLDVVAGLRRVDSVAVSLAAPDDGRPAVYYCEQVPAIFGGSLLDNLALARPELTREEALLACASLGLPVDIDLRLDPTVMSKGEQQRVCIARALLSSAGILLFDEPTAHQDPDNEARIFEVLARASGHRVVLVVTHSPRSADFAPVRIAFPSRGEAAAVAAPAEASAS